MKISVKQLKYLYSFSTGHQEYFDLMMHDRKSHYNKETIYSLDSYDLSSIIYDENPYSKAKIDHFNTMKYMWNQFLADISGDPSRTIVIEPMTFFETIYAIYRSSKQIRNSAIFTPVMNKDILGDTLKKLDALGVDYANGKIPFKLLDKEVQIALKISSKVEKAARSVSIGGGSGLSKLIDLIDSQKIIMLNSLGERLNLELDATVYDQVPSKLDFTAGLNYLNSSRRKSESQFMFNAVDMLRLQSAYNISSKLSSRNMYHQSVTHGLKTLKAWSRSAHSKYLKSSPFRSSVVPCYLMRGMRYHKESKVLFEHMEEASINFRTLSRELESSLNNRIRGKAVDQLADNTFVEVSENINTHLVNIHMTYLNPYLPDQLKSQKPEDLYVESSDLMRLSNIANSPNKRAAISSSIQSDTIKILHNASLQDFEDVPLHGPISDAYIKLNTWLQF